MAFEIFALADEAASRLGQLVDNRSVGDNDWSNEFCRSINVVDKVLRGSYNLIAEIDARKIGGRPAESCVCFVRLSTSCSRQISSSRDAAAAQAVQVWLTAHQGR
jgi:hypothetical protein